MDTPNGNDKKTQEWREDNKQSEAMQRSFGSNLNTGKIPDFRTLVIITVKALDKINEYVWKQFKDIVMQTMLSLYLKNHQELFYLYCLLL
jgi:hypothetical protein